MSDRKEYKKQYYKDNCEKIKKQGKQYYKNNREHKIKYAKQWRVKNLERVKELARKWRKDNPEKVKQYKIQYYKNNPEKVEQLRKLQGKQWRENNSERYEKYKKIYYKNNRREIIKRTNRWIKNNLERYKEISCQYRIKRLKTDLKFNLNNKIRRAIAKSLKGNKDGNHWEELVGYNLKKLINHLTKTMPESYTWQDYLSGDLHIDHIIPISAFNFTRPEHTDFKMCWGLDNLQLLPAKENMFKKDKIINLILLGILITYNQNVKGESKR